MPERSAQFRDADTFTDMIVDNADTMNYLYRCMALIATGEVRLSDVRNFARHTLKGVDLLKPVPR